MSFRTFLPLFLFLTASLVVAEIRLPSGVYRLDQLEAQSKTAKAQKKLLIFVKVNPDNEQSFVQDAFNDTTRRLKTFGPVFLVPLDTRADAIPTPVFLAFNQITGGYPQTVVLDPASDSIVASIPYLKEEERSRELRRHRTEISKYLRERD